MRIELQIRIESQIRQRGQRGPWIVREGVVGEVDCAADDFATHGQAQVDGGRVLAFQTEPLGEIVISQAEIAQLGRERAQPVAEGT